MKLKKISSLIMILSLVTSIVPITATAAVDSSVYYATDSNISVGQDFNIYVNANNLTDLYGQQVDFKFDPTLIQVNSIQPGNFYSGKVENVDYMIASPATITSGLVSEGIVLLGSNYQAGVTVPNGSQLFVIKAHALKAGTIALNTVSDNTTLTNTGNNLCVKLSDSNGNKIAGVTYTKSSFNITTVAGIVLKWDLNGDTVIDSKDLAILKAAILASSTDIKYDSNGDNKINILDYVALSKMIVKLPLADNTNITGAFIDVNFKNAVYELIHKNGPVPILYSDVKNLKNLNIASKGISNLSGLEYFTSLTSLYCGSNQLTSLNVSKNTTLTTLDCSSNKIATLDVSKNTALTYLNCDNNQLTALDVSNNTKLKYLNSSYNQLTALDASLNTALTYLGCSSNKIATLDVSKNIALTYLACSFNQLTTLDVSKNIALAYLSCEKNQLATLYSTKNTWNSSFYKTQYTSVSHTSSTASLVITIKN